MVIQRELDQNDCQGNVQSDGVSELDHDPVGLEVEQTLHSDDAHDPGQNEQDLPAQSVESDYLFPGFLAGLGVQKDEQTRNVLENKNTEGADAQPRVQTGEVRELDDL